MSPDTGRANFSAIINVKELISRVGPSAPKVNVSIVARDEFGSVGVLFRRVNLPKLDELL